MARRELAHSGAMSEEGDSVTTRRERLGLTKIALAKESGVDRDTLADIEAGKGFQALTLAKIADALTRLEDEAGYTAAEKAVQSGIVEFEVSGDFGVRVVVRGPIGDTEELERSVTRLIRNIRESQTTDTPERI